MERKRLFSDFLVMDEKTNLCDSLTTHIIIM